MQDKADDDYEEPAHVEHSHPDECQERLQTSYAQIPLAEAREHAPLVGAGVSGDAPKTDHTDAYFPCVGDYVMRRRDDVVIFITHAITTVPYDGTLKWNVVHSRLLSWHTADEDDITPFQPDYQTHVLACACHSC